MSTHLNEWRARRTKQLDLTCGLTVTVKKVAILDLAAQGAIPTPLVDAVQALLNGEGEAQRVTIEGFPEYARMVDLVVKAAVVEPPVADEPSATHVGLNELPILDRIDIFNWAQEEGAQLTTFPQHSEPDATPARRGRRVSVATVDAAGDC
jgi:hypothetical protein